MGKSSGQEGREEGEEMSKKITGQVDVSIDINDDETECAIYISSVDGTLSLAVIKNALKELAAGYLGESDEDGPNYPPSGVWN